MAEIQSLAAVAPPTSPTLRAPIVERSLKVVVTMPAYHAGRTLEKTLADLPDHLSQHVIVVDDASTDDTVEVAQRLGLTVYAHEENKGYGANQKTCYQAALDADADVVVMLHPDYQYDPKAVPLLIGPILSGHADMTFGSRFAGMSDPRSGGMPWYRYYGNRVTTIAQNLILGTRFSEFHSGLRAYNRKALLSIPFVGYSDDFDFDAQFICEAVTKKLRVVEVPIPTTYTKESSSIAIGASLRYVAKSVRHSVATRATSAARSKLHRTGEPKQLDARGPIDDCCPACGEARHALIYPSTVADGDEVVADEFTCTSATVAYYDDIVQCTGCGVVRSLPDLDQGEIASVYAETEDEVYLDQEQARRELFSWMLDRMDGYVAGERRLLEFGSHIGLFLSEAREHGWLTTGVEPSAWAVAEGRKRFGVGLVQGTIESFPTPTAPYDAVMMCDMLEHVVDPIAALDKARECISDDGLLAVSTINVDSIHGRIRGAEWPWLIRPHLWYYTPESLHDHLARAGFEAIEWLTVPRWFNLSYVLQRGGDNLGPLQKLAPLAEVIDPRLPVGWLGDIVMVLARPMQ